MGNTLPIRFSDPGENRFYNELREALGGMSNEDLLQIFILTAKEAGLATWNSKVEAVKSVSSFAKKTYERYKIDGVKDSIKSDLKAGKDFVLALPEKSQALYEHFLSLSRGEKIETIAVTLMTLGIFFAAGGGPDFEGGLPDTDIAVGGIGAHRSIFTHSIILGFGVEFTARFGIMTLNEIRNRLPVDHHPAWDTIYNFMDKNKNLFIGAMWIGIGTHLLKDSGLIMGNSKPYADLPFSMPMDAHNGLYAANGLASTLFGVQK